MKNKRILGFSDKLTQFWHSQVGEDEAAFYREAIKSCHGKALELAASGGRLLLRFLSEGLNVEGVEAAPAMIGLIASRAQKMGLTPKVYNQPIDHLEISSHYSLIYIPLGSFQFISHLIDSKSALLQYHALLNEGGKLIIPLYLPFGDIPTEALGNWVITSDVQNKKRKERLVTREIIWHDPIEQVITARVRIELWNDRDLFEMTEKEIEMRWYSQGEFQALLEKAGFTSIECRRSYAPHGHPIPSFMLFIATK